MQNKTLTPLMKQYYAVREKYPHIILFFRLGDFYVMFGDQAREVSALLGLTLTARNGEPMCGIPYHSVNTYIPRLLAAGKKIGICEQTGSATDKDTKLFERKVTRIITPGTLMEDTLLNANEANYLVTLDVFAQGWALACVEVSTGEFWVNQNDKDLENTVLYAIALKPTQITLYRNRYKGTKLESEAGGVSLYKAMRQYRLAYQTLTAHGYRAEIGKNTFSREPGDWGTSDYLTHRVIEGTPYLGLGLGAQSFGKNYLSYNEGAATKKMESYREKILAGEFPLQDIYDLPPEESMAKMIAVAFYFGFIDLKCFKKRFGVKLTEIYPEEIEFLRKRQLMELTGDRLALTPRGADYINGVIPLFYSPRSKAELVRLYERRKDPENEGEKTFLAHYSIEKYDRPSVATDVVAMTLRSTDAGNYRSPTRNYLSVLLIRRGEHPFMNRWALPGGFLRHGEPVGHCAQRELFEETGLNTDALYPLGCFSEPGRDPRGWIISNAFLSVIGREDLSLRSGDDAMDARWFDLHFREEGDILKYDLVNDRISLHAELKTKQNAFGQFSFEILNSDLAFDHAKIIAASLKTLQSAYQRHFLAFAFLPAEFTVNELQNVHELLTGKTILAANFRRKILPFLTATRRMTGGEGHRPAIIYTRNRNMED